MTDNEKTLLSRGAEIVAGDMILKRQTVGMYRNGQFILTPEGAEELENVVDAEVTEKPKAKRVKQAKAADPAVDVDADLAGLDDLIEG